LVSTIVAAAQGMGRIPFPTSCKEMFGGQEDDDVLRHEGEKAMRLLRTVSHTLAVEFSSTDTTVRH
jgi:hypothetical protein